MDRADPDPTEASPPRPGKRGPVRPVRPVQRVLVSGGAGFIGSELVATLIADGLECSIVDDLSAGTGPRLARLLEGPRAPTWHKGDIGEPGSWGRVLEAEEPFDAIVHLAGRVGVRRVLADPEACRHANIAGALELVRALAERPAGRRPRVFAASTSEVYAEQGGPLGEDSPLRAKGGIGRWAYAASKRSAEDVLDGARSLWPDGEGPVHLRFFNVVGPGQDARSGMVMPTFIEHALRGEPLPVYGSGDQLRTFGHVTDVARALAVMVRAGSFPTGALNLGGSTRSGVLELARRVLERQAALSGRASGASIVFVDPRRHLGRRFDEVRTREPNLERARCLGLPIRSRALTELVDDCLKHHAQLSIGSASERRILQKTLHGPDARFVPRGGVACASLGS